jgi:DNA-binding CsgD family transcriptional regulator
MAAESDQFAVEVLARHTAVRFGDPAQRVPLAQLARKVPGPYASAAAEHAAAWTSGDVSALLAVADRFAAAGLMLCAAEAAAQAELLARRRLDPVATARASARTAELLAGCDGAWTPALAAAALPPGISERQHEIAELVAAGLSNREVADRLHLSIRTVEGHIYQACVKLGVSNRAELAALLRRRGR